MSDEGGDSVIDGDEPLVYEGIEDLEREFEEWKKEEEERKAKLEAERKKIQEEAVETWKQQQIRELEIHQKKLEEERSSLRAELTKQRVAPQQIEDIINHVHPQEQVKKSLLALNLAAASDQASSVKSSDVPTVARSPRRWRSLLRKYVLEKIFQQSINPLIANRARLKVPLQ